MNPLASAPVVSVDEDAADAPGALHVAIGWLTAAVEAQHPGFIKAEADRAARYYFEHPDLRQGRGVVAVLRRWAAKS